MFINLNVVLIDGLNYTQYNTSDYRVIYSLYIIFRFSKTSKCRNVMFLSNRQSFSIIIMIAINRFEN